VDSLVAEIQSNGEPNRAPTAGRGRGASAGPGPAFARGRGLSSGPGRGASSGPGMNGVGRAKPLATQTHDGRQIVHQGPPCAKCGEMIIGQCLNALGKTYHPEHFVCTHCNQPFPKGAFVEHEGSPYCESDYNELFLPRCYICKLPIADQVVNAAGNKYHPNHFQCTGCGKSLVGQKYVEDDNDVYCTVCRDPKKQRIPPKSEICGKCKKPIEGEYITINGQRMHPYHYRCEECGCEFTGGNCHEYEGKLYCHDDYLKLLRNVCGSCHKPIIGRSITALAKVWHPEHFVCFICHEPFVGSNFYEHDGKPYCETHFTQEFGEVCAKCNRPAIHNVIHFLDKVYHQEHFLCSGCNKPIKKGDLTEWEAKPMCMACYKNLPSEVRKRVEKKREAEAKLAKQKSKEDKKGQNN